MCCGKPASAVSCSVVTPAGSRFYSHACALRRSAGLPRSGAAPAGARTGTRGAGAAGWRDSRHADGRAIKCQGHTRRLRQPAALFPLLQACQTLSSCTLAMQCMPMLQTVSSPPALTELADVCWWCRSTSTRQHRELSCGGAALVAGWRPAIAASQSCRCCRRHMRTPSTLCGRCAPMKPPSEVWHPSGGSCMSIINQVGLAALKVACVLLCTVASPGSPIG